jgi:hypothetical protein
LDSIQWRLDRALKQAPLIFYPFFAQLKAAAAECRRQAKENIMTLDAEISVSERLKLTKGGKRKRREGL